MEVQKQAPRECRQPNFLKDEQITGLEPFIASVVEMRAEGKTAIFVAIDGTAAAVAKQLGIDAVEAEIEPAGKVAHIKKLREAAGMWRWPARRPAPNLEN